MAGVLETILGPSVVKEVGMRDLDGLVRARRAE